MTKRALWHDAGIARAPSLLTAHDIYLYREGMHSTLYDKLGAHSGEVAGVAGTFFAMWAPNANAVSIIGDFNGWDTGAHRLAVRADESGIWETFVPAVGHGDCYKYHITSHEGAYSVEKGDPFAFFWECPPRTASRVWDLSYEWNDADWMRSRREHNALHAPTSVYEVHLGSWRRAADDGGRFLSYRELAEQLPAHVKELGFTHVELMPITEHPFYGSWGYQTTGYFAPTARYGNPEDFMFLVDRLHQHDIAVILDWVPSHFPDDQHGLSYFDGTYLYEHADPKQGYHPEWKSCIFNYNRHEVRAFLISSALFWLDRYHIDGIRVDAVASMLYLDYAREEGEWIPNEHGGNEDLAAVSFLRNLNEAIYREHPDVQSIAEESTSWQMVSRPTYLGGLGFGMKWNMGWMHDTLKYFAKDPVHRKYHHNDLTFSIWYAFAENFLLPLSHDEVVHGKGSLLGKMSGDDWQRFANLRLLLGYMYGHPGKKLLFMGTELAQWSEWNHEESLQWQLLEHPPHQGMLQWIRDLNRMHASEPALHQQDFGAEGFEWIDANDWQDSTISFLRKGRAEGAYVLVVCNFTPVVRNDVRVGVPRDGRWQEVLNSDAECYGGSGQGNLGGVLADSIEAQGRAHSLCLTLPPLSVLFFKNVLASVG